MEDDFFFLDSSQAATLEENKKWIEYLFRVGLTLESDSNDPDLCKCTISSSSPNAKEILVKAKVSTLSIVMLTCTQFFQSILLKHIFDCIKVGFHTH